ncbi:protease [Paenibacillus solisilvae]|uniref:Protease n=1 Tax=Paenibacillus solisilvae TaxID=2486751 RepID=A0ABW0W2B4_9BACL
MEVLLLSCLFGGIFFALISVIIGDWLSMALGGLLDFLSIDGHPVLQPTAIVSGVTVFGGAGLLLERHTAFNSAMVILLAAGCGLIIGISVYFFYILPMERSENSSGYSMNQLAGMIAEVLVPIPAAGYGEVIVKIGAGRSNHIAASNENHELPAGARVVIVEVKEHIVIVCKLDL